VALALGIEGAFLLRRLGRWGKPALLTLYGLMLHTVFMRAIRYQSNRNVDYCCKYHFVWCPNTGVKCEVEQIGQRLKQIVIEEVCQQCQAEILRMDILPDHVQLLVECDPHFGLHRLVRLIKGRSSRLLRQEFPVLKHKLPTLWINRYFVATVGRAPLAVIKPYLENQKHV
jgi:putative transposase